MITYKTNLPRFIITESCISPALGHGWRLGFLGLLHMEVFCQRLDQEYGAESIVTAPSVTYKIKLKPTKQLLKDNATEIFVNNPAHFPDHLQIEESFEPIVLGTSSTVFNELRY